jgi:hypothetical protein
MNNNKTAIGQHGATFPLCNLRQSLCHHIKYKPHPDDDDVYNGDDDDPYYDDDDDENQLEDWDEDFEMN